MRSTLNILLTVEGIGFINCPTDVATPGEEDEGFINCSTDVTTLEEEVEEEEDEGVEVDWRL